MGKRKTKYGRCCSCGYEGEKETQCRKREDRTHCHHWWEGPNDEPHPAVPYEQHRAELEALRRAVAEACAAAVPTPRDGSGDELYLCVHQAGLAVPLPGEGR